MNEAIKNRPQSSGWKVKKILKISIHLSFYHNK